METIKSYLEAMFASMPNTPEVRKAKAELLQMMEDKYNELIADGASENAAVGTVISEFGNLDELAEGLGLEKEVEEVHEKNQEESRRFISLSEVKEFLSAEVVSARRVALGVLLCIISVVPIMIWSHFDAEHDNYGVAIMFVLIAIAVALFVLNGLSGKVWDYLKKENCRIDIQTADYVRNQQESFKKTSILCYTLGVALCILSVIPCIIYDNDLMASLIFGFVGIGVFLFVYASIINSSYEEILQINDTDTISGEYGYEERGREENCVNHRGTNKSYHRRKNRGWKHAFWIVLIVVLVLWACRYITWFVPFGGKSVTDERTFENGTVSEISIDVDASDLTLEYGKTFSVKYTYPEKYAPTITFENGKLDIVEKIDSIFNNVNKKNCEMIVTIPEGTKLDEINLTVDVGDVIINDIEGEKLTLDADCGDIDISGISVTQSKFDIDVGDFDISNSFVGTSIITCDVGDVDGKIEFDFLEVDCNVGSVEITTNSDLNNLTTDCDLGSIRVNGKKR